MYGTFGKMSESGTSDLYEYKNSFHSQIYEVISTLGCWMAQFAGLVVNYGISNTYVLEIP